MDRTVIPRSVLVRDLMIFQIKLVLDGAKDLVLVPLSIVAGTVDIFLGPGVKGYRTYRVLRLGERFDLWLNLFGAAEQAEGSRDGLFGVSRATDPTLLGQLERWSGGDSPDQRLP